MSRASVPLAGFQVTFNGRFWVTPEVLSDRDQPLRGVTVTAINLFDYAEKSATSDEFGSYRIDGLRAGEYHVCAEMYASIKNCVTDDPSWNGIDTAGEGILLDRDRTLDIKLKLRD